MNATTLKNHTACYSVSPQTVELAKQFSGRMELSGHWEDNLFWGTKQAVALLKAFHDGYFARCVETNPNLKR